MRITKDAFNEISKNCPFRSPHVTRIYGINIEKKYHTCLVREPYSVKEQDDACCIDNCAVSYWIDALANIKEDHWLDILTNTKDNQ